MALLIDNLKEVGLHKLIPENIGIDENESSAYWSMYEERKAKGYGWRYRGDAFECENDEYNEDRYDNENGEYIDAFFEADATDEYEALEEHLDYLVNMGNDEDETEEEVRQRLLSSWSSVNADKDYKNVTELKEAFDFDRGFDVIDNEDFLNMSLSDLFGITNPQIKEFVNFEYLQMGDVEHFVYLLHKEGIKDFIPSIEQRIKYAEICCVTGADQFSDIVMTGNPLNLSRSDADKIRDYVKRIIMKHTKADAIDVLSLLKDYYRCLPNAIIINNERQENERFPYEITPKPSHIKDLHNKASRDSVEFLRRQAIETREETDKHIGWVESSPEYMQFLYKDKDFSIIAPKNSSDIEREGIILDHCVANYIPDFANAKTYIYFLRENTDIDKPYFTIEILRKGETTKFRLTQCYTVSDTIPKSAACDAFIRKWAKLKSLDIACEL